MSLKRQQFWGILGALTLTLALLIPAVAQGPMMPDVGAQGAMGRITAVSTTSITVTNREQVAKTYTISSSTMVTIDRQPSTADKLTVGEFAAVTSSDGSTTTAIDAHQRRGGGPDVGPNGFHGKITAISSTSITAENREGTSKTYTIDATATIKLEGQTTTASGIAVGQFAAITSTDGTTTNNIDVHLRPGPPPGGGPGGPGGPGGGGPGGPGGGGPGGPGGGGPGGDGGPGGQPGPPPGQ